MQGGGVSSKQIKPGDTLSVAPDLSSHGGYMLLGWSNARQLNVFDSENGQTFNTWKIASYFIGEEYESSGLNFKAKDHFEHRSPCIMVNGTVSENAYSQTPRLNVLSYLTAGQSFVFRSNNDRIYCTLQIELDSGKSWINNSTVKYRVTGEEISLYIWFQADPGETFENFKFRPDLEFFDTLDEDYVSLTAGDSYQWFSDKTLYARKVCIGNSILPTARTEHNLTWASQSDGRIKLNGTVTEQLSQTLYYDIIPYVKPGQTINFFSGNDKVWASFMVYDPNGDAVNGGSNCFYFKNQYTMTSDATKIFIYLEAPPGAAFENEYASPHIYLS